MNYDFNFGTFMEAFESMNHMPQDKKIIEGLPYKITSEPLKEVGEDEDVPDEDIDRAHELASKKGRNTIKILREYIKKYPNTPCFYNYLYIAYTVNSQNVHAAKIARETIDKFPHYVFGKTALAEYLLKSDKIDEVKDILGEDPELHILFPNREVYHYTEFNGFYAVAGQYYFKTHNLKKLEHCLSLLENSPEPKEEFCKMLRRFQLTLKDEQKQQIRLEDVLNTKTVEVIPKIIGEPVTEKCTFIHPECESLYQYDLDIPETIIEDIKQLPKETLLKDLLNILKDSILRFNEYTLYCEFDSEDPDENNSNEFYFLNHALNILQDIDDGTHIQQVLDVFRQDFKFIEFWFSDEIFEDIDYFVKFGYAHLQEIKEFIYEPNRSGLSKAAVICAIKYIADENEDKREELSEFLLNMFSFFYDNRNDENLIDTEVIIAFIDFFIDLNDHRADELIKLYYEDKLLPISIFGTYDDVINSIDGKEPENKEEILDFVKRFKEKLIEIEDRKSSPVNNYLSQSKETNSFKNVGRNDPCPCGSGKKYKKCCLNKVKGFS